MAAETDTQAQTNASTSGITMDDLKSTLSKTLSTTYLHIEDMSGGCGQMYEAIIVSSDFNGKRQLARQKLVNGALKQEIAAIHAWSPFCYTPDEWEAKKERAPGKEGMNIVHNE